MAASSVYLSGGPCDGKTVSANQIVGGLVAYIACGGGYYTADPDGRTHSGNPVFDWAGRTKPGPPPGPGLDAPKALKGWKDLRKAFNKRLPETVAYARHGNRAALRSLGRARKVRL